jgi:hypothetical protein
MAEVNTNTPLKALMNDPAIVADHERMIAAAPDAAPLEQDNDALRIDWAESKPGRWIGVTPKGTKYIIDADNDTPIGGAFYELSRITDAPAGTRFLGGASELSLAQDMASRHLTVGRV